MLQPTERLVSFVVVESQQRQLSALDAPAHWVEGLRNRRVEHRAIQLSACSLTRATLIRLLHTARFARVLRRAHSLAPELIGERFLSMKYTRRFHTVSTHSAPPPLPNFGDKPSYKKAQKRVVALYEFEARDDEEVS